MSGMQYLPLSINDVFPGHMTKAEKAGMPADQVKRFYDLVAEVAKGTPLSYEEAEDQLLRLWEQSQHEKNLEEMKTNLQEVSEAIKRQASMRMASGETGTYVQ